LWREKFFEQICNREVLRKWAAKKDLGERARKRQSRLSQQLLRNGRLNNFMWHGAVVEDDFYHKLDRLSVHWQAEKRNEILAALVVCMCEAHDTVM